MVKMPSAVASALLLALCSTSACRPEKELISPPPPFVEKAGDASSLCLETVPGSDCFQRGAKALRWSSSSSLALTLGGERMASIGVRPETAYGWFDDISKMRISFDSATNSVVGAAEFPMNKEKSASGSFVQTAKLLPDGRVDIELAYSIPESSAPELKEMIFHMEIPRSVAEGKTIKLDGKTLVLPSDADWGNDPKMWINSMAGKAKLFEFNAQNPAAGFKLEIPSAPLTIVFRKKDGVSVYFTSMKTLSGSFHVLLDFGPAAPGESKSDSVVAGINFTQCDNLDVPVFAGSRNLLMNPSFEAGTRYWFINLFGCFTDLRDGVVTCDAPFGKRAFKLSGATCELPAVEMPICENKPYAISFYAKGPAPVSLSVKTFNNWKGEVKEKLSERFQPKKDEWTRFSFILKIPRSAAKFAVSSKDALVGGFQFEEGDKATEYCGNKFGVELVTDSPEGIVVDAAKKANARLIVRGPAGATGVVSASATDFFSRKLGERSFPFKLDEKGEAVLPLDVDDVLPLGPTVVKVEVRPDSAPSYVDYLRVVRMVYADVDSQKTRLLAKNYPTFTPLSAIPDSHFDFYRKCGFGTLNYGGPHAPDAADFERLKRLGVRWELLSPVGVWGWDNRAEKIAWSRFGQGFTLDSLTQEDVKRMEEDCFKFASERPFLDTWMGPVEPESWCANHEENFAKLMIAMQKGLKKAKPSDLVLPTGGPCNMGEEGVRSLEMQLAACKRLAPDARFDGVAIHPYRAFPEMPDLDEDAQKLFAMLKRQGYDDAPVYFNEGNYFCPVNVPAWNAAPWFGPTCMDRYIGLMTPSYDIGWAERVAAAMSLRYWLVCFKYMDRVKMATAWAPLLMDNRTPYSSLTATSTLVSLLGRSTFKRDVRFAPGARAYVFEDDLKRPVAAVWFFSEPVERGKALPPGMLASFKGQKLEFFDMFGNESSVKNEADGSTRLPLSNFPFYVRGEAGKLDALCESLQNASIPGADLVPLAISAKPVSKDAVEATLANTLTRSFVGSVSFGDEAPRKLAIAASSSQTVKIVAKDCAPYDRIGGASIPFKLSWSGRKPLESEFVFRAFSANYAAPGSVKIDGSLDDWARFPAIKLTNCRVDKDGSPAGEKAAKSFSASMRVAWNEKALCMLFEIEDSEFNPDRKDKKPSAWYNVNGIQLFLDTLGDAATKPAGYDENDYAYELLPIDSSSGLVYRRFSPDHQLTGGVFDGLRSDVVEKGVVFAFRQDGRKLIYEAEFPARYIMPMPLRAGGVSGLGVKIYNHDGTLSIVNVGKGKDVFRTPAEYPALLLVK